MSVRLTASAARQNFSDILNRAAYGGERVIVHRGKKAVAAVVPIEDLDLIERLEDEFDVKAALKALKEPGAIPWGDSEEETAIVKSAYGLCDSVQADCGSAVGEATPTDPK